MSDKKILDKKKPSKVISKALLSYRVASNLKQKHNVSLSKSNVLLVLGEIWEEVVRALKEGKEIRLTHFCTFKTAKRKPRTAMNLKTKRKMIIPEKLVPKIKFSQAIKEAIAEDKGGIGNYWMKKELKRGS